MWPREIAPLVVHCAFFASLTTLAALIAIWSALSTRHRLLRLAAFCALPGAMVVASAAGLATWLLVEMLPIALLLIAVRFLAKPPFGRTWAGLPRVRFGFRDLFYAIFLVALALSAVLMLMKQRYVPPTVPPSLPWTQWILEPLGLVLPVFGALAFVVTRWRLAWRLAAMTVGFAGGIAAWYGSQFYWYGSQFYLNGAAGWFVGWGDIDWRWLTWAEPASTGIATAACLALWRAAARRPGPGGESLTRSPSARAAVIAVIIFLTLPVGYMYWQLIRPVPVPESTADASNVYPRLVAIGKQLWQPSLSPQQKRQLLAEARGEIASVSVVLDYTEEPNRSIGHIRNLERELNADARSLAASGPPAAAAAAFLEALILSDRLQKGANQYLARVVALYALAPGVEIGSLAPSLTTEQTQALLTRVRQLDVPWESVEQIMQREHAYVCHTEGWRGRWREAVLAVSRYDRDAKRLETAQDGARAQLRILICELAIDAFRREHGRFPESLEELVPEFLESVPLDPFDGQPIKYDIEATQYTLHSAGHALDMFPTALRVVRPIATAP